MDVLEKAIELVNEAKRRHDCMTTQYGATELPTWVRTMDQMTRELMALRNVRLYAETKFIQNKDNLSLDGIKKIYEGSCGHVKLVK